MTKITDIQNSTSPSEHLVRFAFFITTINAGLLFMARSLAGMFDLQHGDHEDPHTIAIFTDALDADSAAYANLEKVKVMLAQFPDDLIIGIDHADGPDKSAKYTWQRPAIINGQDLGSCRGMEDLEDLLLQMVGVPDGSICYDHPHFADTISLANTPGFQGQHMKEAQARRNQLHL